MKRILISTLTLLLVIFTSYGQYSRASLWTSNMATFASEDATNGVKKNVVLFTGSSTFTMWSSLSTDFPNSPVLNRAFGGSWMTDLIYYFGNVVEPYAPIQVVLYEGDNDLYGTTKTAEEFLDDVITMTRMINVYYPAAKILLVSIKPSPSRTSAFAKYQAANALMKSYADKVSYIDYVDTWTPMLNGDGTPNTTLFGSDMLHMNASGYALWKSILEPLLLTGKNSSTSDANIYIDFGSTALLSGAGWNDITDTQTANVTLNDKSDVSTGITLKITDPFYNGYNTAGSAVTSDAAADIVTTASQDNFFGHTLAWGATAANPLGEIELSGLNPNKYYTFTIFGSRANSTDIRETLYTAVGLNSTKTATLDCSNNTSKVAELKSISPNSQGKIIIKVEAGPNNNNETKFFYIGAMKISISDVPSGVIALSVDKTAVYYKNGVLNIGDITGKVSVFDTTGKKVGEGQSVFGNFKINLSKGIYIAKMDNFKRKFIVD
ncbi:MAG: GDSL-type esterase/lipase family protein [Paludibacteraceae bacterium]